jgi:ribulose-5-phosphate 4-epimerase/fuculose-1-phosphate aldolase
VPNYKREEPCFNAPESATALHLHILRHVAGVGAVSKSTSTEIAGISDAMRKLNASNTKTAKGINGTLKNMHNLGLLARWKRPGSIEFSYYLPGVAEYLSLDPTTHTTRTQQ